MASPSSDTSSPPGFAVTSATPLQVWDHTTLASVRLEQGEPDGAALRISSQVTTPDGRPTVAITMPGRPGPRTVLLRLTPTLALRVGGSYEVSLLCRASAQLGIRIDGPSADPGGAAVARSWTEVLFTCTVTEASVMPGLQFIDPPAAAEVHLGPIVLRERREIAPLDEDWSLFLTVAAPRSFADIPSSLSGPRGPVSARRVAFTGGSVDLASVAEVVQERDRAVLFRRFDSPIDGILRLGVSADWWMELHCNGTPIFSTMQGGNGSGRFIPQDHLVEVPVRAGSNLLAVTVLSGSRGWRVVLGALGLAQRPASPRGTVVGGEFSSSVIYPGSTRRYWVYIPAQYDAARPACLYVSQDGHHVHFTESMDMLIDAEEMPVTVGLFINSGLMEAPSETAAARGNRCYEYDSLGDDYARFLLEEMIPFIAKAHQLRLSDSGNDRAIGGCSSGGICAFNAAWERPDAFRRVYTNSGSFVAFRGGNILPALIRKHEAKPIRVFTHVATQDMENSGGNWWFANQEFERSLAFSGYDYSYHWSGGGHGDRYVDAFPEAMRWLWRDHPAPVLASPGPERIREILRPDEPWRVAADALTDAICLAAGVTGEVVVCSKSANHISRIGRDGAVAVLHRDAGGVSALAHDAEGRLYGVSPASRRLLAFDGPGQYRVIASGVPGSALVASHGGGFYVSGQDQGQGTVWRVEADGTSRIVDTGLRTATAVAISIDGWVLYVADGASHFVYAYRINADGSLANKERMVWLHVPDNADDSGASALACTVPANLLLVATRLGIQTSARDGHNQCIIPSPRGRMTGLCFGGEGFGTLYACCEGRVYTRNVLLKGHHAFHGLVKPQGYSL